MLGEKQLYGATFISVENDIIQRSLGNRDHFLYKGIMSLLVRDKPWFAEEPLMFQFIRHTGILHFIRFRIYKHI